MKIIDASNQIVGRLSSTIAKSLMEGAEITVVNSKNAIVTGDPKMVTKKYKVKVERGDPHHGPFYPKTPEGILKRSVRGMIPYKKSKGREAMKRLMIYSGNPKELKGEGIVKGKKDVECNFITLGDLSKKLRGFE